MDNFTFTLPGGPFTVRFHETPSLSGFPQAGGMYVADTNTAEILKKTPGFNASVPLVILEAGESHKNFDSIKLILETALRSSLARDSVFVGFGGGVICDMTAFAASLYMRGARLQLIPTTLLAMADAAIGGKTGIDFENYKNCVGSFYPAEEIHIATAFLSSLSEREYRSGLAEVFKTALLYAPKLYQIMRERRPEILLRDPQLLAEIVRRCVQAKAKVVERDFRESGERMFLNLGHTFGHALESVAGFGAVTHGDAVAWGIGRAMDLGLKLGITDADYAAEIKTALAEYQWSADPLHPVFFGKDSSEIATKLLTAMKNDKKKRDGAVRFVLQREINSTLVTEVPDEAVLAVLK